MQEIGRKLQLKQDQTILLLNAPEEFTRKLADKGYASLQAEAATGKEGAFDAVQLFVKDKAELDRLAPTAARALKRNGIFWIAYPKKSSHVKSDLTRDEGWKTISDLGYEGVRQIAIDETWSSLRFKHKSERVKPSKMGATYSGIDKAARTVVPPDDMQAALEAAGITENFQQMAFTQKKERVVAVLEAKRPDTRTSRILKTVEQVKGMFENKPSC